MRMTHWINAVALIVMLMSGLRIYNASPIFSFSFPAEVTLGAWLGGALLWHFAAMWLFAVNGLLYLCLNIVTGRWKVKFFPISLGGMMQDIKSALHGHLAHDDLSKYNMVQKAAYLVIIIDMIVLVLSGLVIWKSVQFPILRELMAGYDNARIVHFVAMVVAVLFLVVHLVMVALVPRTLLAMVRGR